MNIHQQLAAIARKKTRGEDVPGTRMFVGASGTIYEYSLSTAWDISSASYTGNSFTPYDTDTISFKSDGTAFYAFDASNEAVYQYDLAPVWDITSASLNGSHDVTASDDGTRELLVANEGQEIWFVGTEQDRVQVYPMTTAWDIDGGYGGRSMWYDVSSQLTSFNGMFVTADNLYLMDSSGNLFQWSLTSWDSPSYVRTSTPPYPSSGNENGLWFSEDGTKCYIGLLATSTDDSIEEFTLSTAWDISSMSHSASFVIAGDTGGAAAESLCIY
jgi:hypothetical protein